MSAPSALLRRAGIRHPRYRKIARFWFAARWPPERARGDGAVLVLSRPYQTGPDQTGRHQTECRSALVRFSGCSDRPHEPSASLTAGELALPGSLADTALESIWVEGRTRRTRFNDVVSPRRRTGVTDDCQDHSTFSVKPPDQPISSCRVTPSAGLLLPPNGSARHTAVGRCRPETASPAPS